MPVPILHHVLLQKQMDDETHVCLVLAHIEAQNLEKTEKQNKTWLLFNTSKTKHTLTVMCIINIMYFPIRTCNYSVLIFYYI